MKLPFQKNNKLVGLEAVVDRIDEGFVYCRMIYDRNNEPADCIYLHANPAFAKQTSLSIGRLAGKSAGQVTPGAITAEMLARCDAIVKTGKSRRFETYSAALAKTYAVFAWRPEPGCFAATFTDTSNQIKLAEEARKWKSAMELVEDPVFSKDLDGIITSWNKSAERVYGFTKKEIMGKPALVLAPPDRKAEIYTLLGQIKDGTTIKNYETERVAKNGERLDVLINLFPIRKRGTITGAWVVHYGSAKQKLTNERLLAANQELAKSKLAMRGIMEDLKAARTIIDTEKVKDEAMLNSIGEGIVATDNDQNITVMNKAAEDMLGWKSSDVLGRHIDQLRLEDAHTEQAVPSDQLLHTVAAKTSGSKPDYYYVRKDGSRFPTSLTAAPIQLGHETLGTIEIFRDTTEERKLELAKNDFISLASHQLRTPLGITKWYLEALEARDDIMHASPRSKSYIQEMYRSNERVLNLVRNLLSISHIEQGNAQDDPKPSHVEAIAKEVTADLAIMAREQRITIKLNVGKKPLPIVRIDAIKLQEVIENLVVNGIVYNRPGGSLVITIDRDANNFIIAVKDSGDGVSAADSKRLFTKFFRSEKAAVKNTQGTGLGLYMVKSYMEGWGGSVSVTSTEGKGSTFTLRIPLKPTNF